MNSLQRPFPVRAVTMSTPHAPYQLPLTKESYVNAMLANQVVNSDQTAFRPPLGKDQRNEHPVEKQIPLDPMFIKVLHKIFPQLGSDLISRELTLCSNDLTKTVEIMLMKYRSALEDVPLHSNIPMSITEQHFGKATFLQAPQSPKQYSRESSPSSVMSGYSPGPPQLYTPVVYPSDSKYEQAIRQYHSEVESRLYGHESHHQHEASQGFDHPVRGEDKRAEGVPQRRSPYQNGVLSYEEALHISASRQNKENTKTLTNHLLMTGQAFAGAKEERTEIEYQEPNVTSSNGRSKQVSPDMKRE